MAFKPYYHLRIKGTEDYMSPNRKWGPMAKAQLFTKHAIKQWLSYWIGKNRLHDLPEDINPEDIEVVEYNLIESRILRPKDLLNKLIKTPILGN